MIPRFRALACQTIVRPITEDVQTRKEGRAIIKENLDAIGLEADTGVSHVGALAWPNVRSWG